MYSLHEIINIIEGNEVVQKVKAITDDLLGKDSCGHDFYHSQRVARLAQVLYLYENNYLLKNEAPCDIEGILAYFMDETGGIKEELMVNKKALVNKNQFIYIALLGYFHDCLDHKLFSEIEQENNKRAFCEHVSREVLLFGNYDSFFDDIQHLSYSKNKEKRCKISKVAEYVQDADRLDALGAIGIARAFAYGGARGQLMYDEIDEKNSLQHFHDKLYHLPELMNTEVAKEVATKKVIFMQAFENLFKAEWHVI